jgi:superfamily II DNA or RNA helicase
MITEPHPILGYRLFPDLTAGKYDGKNEYDITLATYSQLGGSKGREPMGMEFYKDFGVLICDEWHLAGSKTFNNINMNASCKYRLHLTATFRRADNLEEYLKYHIDKIITIKADRADLSVFMPFISLPYLREHIAYETRKAAISRIHMGDRIKVVPMDTEEKPYEALVRAVKPKEGEILVGKSLNSGSKDLLKVNKHKFYLQEDVKMSFYDTAIAKSLKLIKAISTIIRKEQAEGRKVLLLSRRKALLYRIARFNVDTGILISDKDRKYKAYIKETLKRDVKEYIHNIEKFSAILAIEELAKIGLDLPSISTMIIVHPMKDVEQAIGRLDRGNGDSGLRLYMFNYDIPIYRALVGKAEKQIRELYKSSNKLNIKTYESN